MSSATHDVRAGVAPVPSAVGTARRLAGVPLLRVAALAGTLAGAIAAVGVRLTGLHEGLLYPDGYQYLLMARGIAEGGRPVTRLGPGGAVFVPSVDAAVKPLYPALVAAADVLGVDPVAAARGITALAGGIAVVLCALLARRLTGSAVAALTAGALLLLSPAVSHWSGFLGPDPLAQALVLGAALAAVCLRPVPAGVLGGAAACTRPELALVVLAFGVAALAADRQRERAVTALLAAVSTASVVVLAVRPPVPLPSVALATTGAAVGTAAALAFVCATRLPRATTAGLLALLAALLAARSRATVVETDWPLLAAGATGALLCLRHASTARLAATTLVPTLVLAGAYVVKNPGSDRYLTLLLPAACLLVAGGVSTIGRAASRLTLAGGALLALLLLGPVPGAPGGDPFAAVAARLPRSAAPLVTAAPDAYGFLLPGRTVHAARPGARGDVLLDGAQRAYEPTLAARGVEVARLSGVAFLRPGGTLDTRAARVVHGVVTERRTPGRAGAAGRE